MQLIQRTRYWWMKFQFKGRQYYRSTGVSVKADAERIAREFRRQVVLENWGAVEASKLRSDHATIGAVIEKYLEKATHLAHNTAPANVGALRIVVREGLGLGEQSDPEKEKTTVLTAELARRFVEGRFSAAKGKHEHGRASTTCNSTLRQACSVFSKKAMGWYAGMNLPDLAAFKAWERQEEPSHSFRPPDAAKIEEMEAAALKLKDERPALYKAWLLMIRLGLRNVEVVAARWNWLERQGDVWGLAIVRREDEDFSPKKSERWVPMSEAVRAQLEEGREGDYLVPAANPTERKWIAYRELSAFCRPYFPGRQKSAYELRKLAGSRVATRDGSLRNAQAFLGHASPTTTAKHYDALLRPVAPL